MRRGAYQAQPYRNGGKAGPARRAMRRGRPRHRVHPMDERRKMERRAAVIRKALKRGRRK